MSDKQITDHLVKDTILKPIVERTILPQLVLKENLFKELIESIIYQQLSTKVAAIIASRFYVLLKTDNPSPQEVLSTTVEEKRAVGLSYSKANYIDNIALFWIENSLHEVDWVSKSDEEIVHLLTKIKGVGKWTAEMVLMFSLCRPDVFPHDDLGIKTKMVELYELGSTGKQLIKEMTDIAENWRPYRSTACRYLWKFKDQ